VWKIARTDTDIAAFRNRTMFFGASATDPVCCACQVRFVAESSTTIDALTGLPIDTLEFGRSNAGSRRPAVAC